MTTTIRNPIYRSGLTIIEVMTSIVVALIGVMGVMILVPFAVRQAQTGLDTEAAAVVARNAFSLFEIGGYRNQDNWVSIDSVGAKEIRRLDSDFPRNPYSIDPLGILEHPAGSNYVDTFFPFNQLEAFPGDLHNNSIRSVNLRLPGPTIPVPPNDYTVLHMEKIDARRMFRAGDDLVFGEALSSAGNNDAQLNGPRQLFDIANGLDVRRQSAGRFSWSAIVDPVGGGKWKVNILVYKDRDVDVTAPEPQPVNFSFSPKMRVATVTQPSAIPNVQIRAEIAPGSVKKDEWIMLVNRGIADPLNWQIRFYRIISFEQITQTGNPNPVSLLTVDGPDNFEFDPTIRQPTSCIHLKNVVGVYERTIVPEGNSNWNLTY